MSSAFDVGDLVWAKMRNFCYWPGEIQRHPPDTKSSILKKPQHYVFFFGSNNCAWISDDKIVHHSEQQVQQARSKKMLPVFKIAVDTIAEKYLQLLELSERHQKKLLANIKKEVVDNEPSNCLFKAENGILKFDETLVKVKIEPPEEGEIKQVTDITIEKHNGVVEQDRPKRIRAKRVKPNKAPITEIKLEVPDEKVPSKKIKIEKTDQDFKGKVKKEKSDGKVKAKKAKTVKAKNDTVKKAKTKKARPEKVKVKNEYAKGGKTQKVQDKKPKSNKMKAKKVNMEKSIPKKRKSEEMLPPPRIIKRKNSFSQLFAAITSNLNLDKSIAIVRPYDKSAASKKDCSVLPPPVPLDMKFLSDNLKKKGIVPTKMKIGFIGLGDMGKRIVRNLLNTGHKVTIWHPCSAECKPFEEIGAVVVQTPTNVVESSNIIFSCLSDSTLAEKVLSGFFGVLNGFEGSSEGGSKSKKKGYVEMTTIDPNTSKKFSEAIESKGGRYLEAQISGSRKQAEIGVLNITAAGNKELFDDCESCFKSMAESAYYTGNEIGCASQLSLILNAFLGVTYASLAESLVLVERLGLSPSNLLEVIQMSPLNCNTLIEKGNSMCHFEFATDTSVKYMQRDIAMTLQMSDPTHQPLPLTSAANNSYKHAQLMGYSEHDVAALYFSTKF